MKKLIIIHLSLFLLLLAACQQEENAIDTSTAAPLAPITIATRADGDQQNFIIWNNNTLTLTVKDATGDEKTVKYDYTDDGWEADPNFSTDVITCATGSYPAYAYGKMYVNYPDNPNYTDVLFVTWVGSLTTTVAGGVATADPIVVNIAGTRVKITLTGAYGETDPNELPDFMVTAALKRHDEWVKPANPYTDPYTLSTLDYVAAEWYLSTYHGYSPGHLVPTTVADGELLFTLTADGTKPHYGTNQYKVYADEDLTFLAGQEYHFTIALGGGGVATINNCIITDFIPGGSANVDGRTPGIYNEADLRRFVADWEADPTNAITRWEDPATPGTIRLMNDIKIEGDAEPLRTIGSNLPFNNATFDGGGHTISSIKIMPSHNQAGLFGEIGTGGTVRHLHLHLHADGISAPGADTGGIAAFNEGTIIACSVQGDITGSSKAGGIAAINTGTILACTFQGNLTATNEAGGIAANNYGTIAGCYSQADGFPGTGTAYGIALNVDPAATITACHWLTGTGLPTDASNTIGTTTACHSFTSQADFQADAEYTRLMNNALAAQTKKDYSWLRVAGTMPVLMKTPPVAIPVGMLITTEAHLRQLSADWAANPAFALLTWADIDGIIRLAADITLSDAPFPPIGTYDPINFFTAVFDGQGHTLTGLYINEGSTTGVGLFGTIDPTGVVRNLHLRDADVTGKNYVGGIAGINGGIVAACSFQGTVEATNRYAGGIAGNNTVSTTPTPGTYGTYGCYSLATSVTDGGGDAYGIAGGNFSTIRGSHWLVDGAQPTEATKNVGTATYSYCSSFADAPTFNEDGTYLQEMNAALDACGVATMRWKATPGDYPILETNN